MPEVWIDHLVDLLKYLESESNGKQIHQFRRSFQGGNKKERLLPQLERMYQYCKQAHNLLELCANQGCEEEPFQNWFNLQKFRLILGRKNIVLKSTGSPALLKQRLLQLFTKWDPELVKSLPPPTPEPANSNMGFSRKQMRMAMRKLQTMGDQQLSNVLQNVPQDADINEEDLDSVFDKKSAARIKSALHQ